MLLDSGHESFLHHGEIHHVNRRPSTEYLLFNEIILGVIIEKNISADYMDNLEYVIKYQPVEGNHLDQSSQPRLRSVNDHWDKKAWNAFGLIDMIGNVWEIGVDCILGGSYSTSIIPNNATGHVPVPIRRQDQVEHVLERVGVRRIIELYP